jgi:type VI protein secretion system component VasK
MRRLRALLSMTLLCVLAGVAGGLGLGYILSRRGEWLVPQPWVIYAAALLVVTGALTWLDLRRRPAATVSTHTAMSGTEESVSEPTAAEPAATTDEDGAGGEVVE